MIDGLARDIPRWGIPSCAIVPVVPTHVKRYPVPSKGMARGVSLNAGSLECGRLPAFPETPLIRESLVRTRRARRDREVPHTPWSHPTGTHRPWCAAHNAQLFDAGRE